MSSKNTKLFTRIVALFLAVLMFGGVLVATVQVFAMPMQMSVAVANTGESNANMWIIIVAVVAMAILVATTILPKLLKKE